MADFAPSISTETRIAIVGLGYVGLPLLVALDSHFKLTGFDINDARIEALKNYQDTTNEVESSALEKVRATLTTNPTTLSNQDIFIVTVPTPITKTNEPDLTPLKKACETIGPYLKKNSVVVFESTVYPGVTENLCGPWLEEHSGLTSGVDFYLGYSPERINPGDKVHTLDKITKIVSGQNKAITEALTKLYGHINQNNIFQASSIQAAETAKVIENAQRDINIAFINEITMIVQKLGLSIHDVLEAANTKWNFLDFKPGLVGGHCIGVDPYYMAHLAKKIDHEPEAILAGRKINEHMASFIANRIHQNIRQRYPKENCQLLVLGLTFKENVPDLRNTKVTSIIHQLESAGHAITVHDPLACPIEAKKYYGIELIKDLKTTQRFHGVIAAVPHKDYLKLSLSDLEPMLFPQGLIADIKGIWRKTASQSTQNYWSL